MNEGKLAPPGMERKKGRKHQSKYIDFSISLHPAAAEVFYHNKSEPEREHPFKRRKAKPHTSLQTIYISLRAHYINGTRARRRNISS